MKKTKKNEGKDVILKRLRDLSGKDLYLKYKFHIRALRKDELYSIMHCVETMMDINSQDRGNCWAWIKDIFKKIETEGVDKRNDQGVNF